MCQIVCNTQGLYTIYNTTGENRNVFLKLYMACDYKCSSVAFSNHKTETCFETPLSTIYYNHSFIFVLNNIILCFQHCKIVNIVTYVQKPVSVNSQSSHQSKSQNKSYALEISETANQMTRTITLSLNYTSNTQSRKIYSGGGVH